MRRRLALLVALATALTALGAGTASAAAGSIRHVFIIVLENESASTTFAPGSPAPYLATTLRSQGAYVPNYYGIGHNSNPNYIAMISGQAPNAQTQADCQNFTDVLPGTIGANGQAQGTGCVYPTAVPTIASQLTGAGLTWRSYNEDMGADPAREASVCAHPAINAADNTQTATATDEYATRHNPFVYFHGIIDNTTLCNTHVVGLDALGQDLQSPATVPNYSFITPGLCNDGHDAPCKNGQPGGLVSADQFLQTWVPRITASAAYRQDGLLMVLFDEAAGQQPGSCCGEIAGPGSPMAGINGPGGGQTGAVLLSPCIAPGTVTQTAYNHYSMLASVEDIFGLAHIGYAAGPGAIPFGADIYNRSCGATSPGAPPTSPPGGPGAPGAPGAPPTAAIVAPSLLSNVSSRARIPLHLSVSTAGGTGLGSYTVRVRDLGARLPSVRAVASRTRATSLTYRGRLGHSYTFTVTATNLAGQTGPAASVTVLVPSGVRPPEGHYSRSWRVRPVRGAWQGRAIASHVRGATLKLRYAGGGLALIGERGARGGVARVTLDGRTQLIRLHAPGRLRTRQVIYRGRVRFGHHRLTVRVIRGTVRLEGVAIAGRRP